MAITFKINPDFIKHVRRTDICRWARSLEQAEKKGITQRVRGMLSKNQHGIQMCCLMVGHTEWGGVDSQRNGMYPANTSPFTHAMKSHNPSIAILGKNERYTASDLNDDQKLTFKELATLLRKGEVTIEEG